MDVAKDRPYLGNISNTLEDLKGKNSCTYHVKMYCAWLFLKLTSAARPIGIPLARRSYDSRRSGTTKQSVSGSDQQSTVGISYP